MVGPKQQPWSDPEFHSQFVATGGCLSKLWAPDSSMLKSIGDAPPQQILKMNKKSRELAQLLGRPTATPRASEWWFGSGNLRIQ